MQAYRGCKGGVPFLENDWYILNVYRGCKGGFPLKILENINSYIYYAKP